jgi:hypothetical protein
MMKVSFKNDMKKSTETMETNTENTAPFDRKKCGVYRGFAVACQFSIACYGSLS